MQIQNILKNTAKLGGATAISQGLILLASPLLTRIYSPQDFGLLAVFGALLGIISGSIGLKYEQAIPLAQDDAEAANVGALSGLIQVVMVGALCAFLLAFDDNLSDWLNSPDLKPYLWLLPIGVFAVGTAEIGRLWAFRVKEFNRLAAAGVISSIGVLAVQLGLGILQFGPVGLLLGRAFGAICGSLVMFPFIRKTVMPLMPKINRSGIVEVAKQHHAFPFYFFPSWGVNSLGRQMPIFFLSLYFGPAITGLYALTRRTLDLPNILIGEQVRKVYYSYAVDQTREGDLRRLTKSIVKSLMQITLPTTVILGIIAPELFGFVFGDQWADSGIYAQWLSPMIFINLVCSPLTRLPIIMGRQRQELLFQLVLLLMRALALVAGGIAHNVEVTFGLFCVVSFLCWVGYMIWSTNLIGIKPIEVLGMFLVEIAVTIPIVAPLIVMKIADTYSRGSLWVLATSVGCALIAMLVLFVRTKYHFFPRVAIR